MANDKKFVAKNGLQTQNILFKDSAGGVHNITIQLIDSDVLSFEGDAGQLFSLSDTMDGVIYSVNDISGIPSIEVDADGIIRLAEFTGNVLVGTDSDDGSKFQITGSLRGDSATFDGPLVTSGDILPNVDNTGNLGTALKTWNQGYFTNMVVDGTLALGGHTVNDIDITSEYSGADDHLMTSAAINARILDFNYTTANVGAYPLVETSVGIQMSQSNHYHVSGSGQTMTLPPADSADRLELSVRNFTNTTVARNGNKIMGIAEDITLNVPYSSLTFEFIDSDYGWFVSDTRGDVTVVNSYNGTFDSAQFPNIDINNDTHSILDSDRLPPLPSPANDATITLTAGNGLITGGSFTTDQAGNVTITHALGTPSTLTSTTTNAVTDSSHTHVIDETGFSIAASQLTGTIDSARLASFDISADTHGSLAYSRVSNTPTIGNGTVTISAGSGLLDGGSFTTNQTGGSTIILKIDSASIPTLTGGLLDSAAIPSLSISTDTHGSLALSRTTGTLDSSQIGSLDINNDTHSTLDSARIPTLQLSSDIDGTTTDLPEGTNLYFTNARSRSAISVTDTGGEGSLAYDSGTGVMIYTGPLPSVGAYPLIETAVDITMSQSNHYHVSDSAVTMTLPSADSADRLELSVRNFTNTTVARNGNKIMGLAEDITINVAYSSLTFEFIDSDFGWFVSDTRGDVTVVNSYNGTFDSAQFPSIDINNDTHSILDSDRLPPLPSPANDATITLSAGNGLITGGSFTTDQAGNSSITHTLGTPSTLTGSTTNAVTPTSHTHEIDETGFSIAASQLTGDVALGTGTSGSYVQQGATSGSGISGSVNSESGTFNVTSNATNLNTASTTVFRDASGNFSAGTITAALTGNASTATTAAAWTTGRTITLTGHVTGASVAWDGSSDISFATAVGNDTHTHDANNLTGGTLAAGVIASSLTSVGTLTNLDVDNVNVNGSTVTYNSIAATTAATNTLATITETSIASFTAATYGGGKFVITAKDGVNRHICELLVTHDGTTAIATQYGSISTAGDLATYDVDINAGSVRILATSASTASTVYNVSETLLAA